MFTHLLGVVSPLVTTSGIRWHSRRNAEERRSLSSSEADTDAERETPGRSGDARFPRTSPDHRCRTCVRRIQYSWTHRQPVKRKWPRHPERSARPEHLRRSASHPNESRMTTDPRQDAPILTELSPADFRARLPELLAVY